NTGCELAHGLLPWERRIVLGSPRPVDTAMLAFSPLSVRYLSPYTEHIRGGSGSYVVDAAIERVERHADGYRIHASGTTWQGELELESDEVIAATGFRAPVRDLPGLGVAMVNDGRMPAQTPYWESISVPGIYFAGNVTQASPGLRTSWIAMRATRVRSRSSTTPAGRSPRWCTSGGAGVWWRARCLRIPCTRSVRTRIVSSSRRAWRRSCPERRPRRRSERTRTR